MTLKSPISLDFGFKGERTYLHATDFVDAINKILAAGPGGFLARMTFQRLARRHTLLWLTEPPDPSRVVARGAWRCQNGSVVPLSIEETDREIVSRRPYDESHITDVARIDGSRITGTRTNPYSAIENVIALTKALNYALTPEVDGKWLVGRIDLLSSLPNDWREMVIQSLSVTAGAFSRNSILIDTAKIGEIRFIVGRP